MSAFELPAGITLSSLRFRVRDLESCRRFYTDVLGLEVVSGDSEEAVLSPGEGRIRLELAADPDAPRRPYPCRGLYHFALLLPDRKTLGATLQRLVDVSWPLEGMADHGVSEALYLRDPEMNGIELYRDRPREEWPTRDGEVAMGADPLDARGLADAADAPAPLDPATVLGHVHMHVDSLEDAERFYGDTLGMRVTQRSYGGALFLAAGDYHHHVGTNTWAPKGAVDPAATGLLRYEIGVPEDAWEGLRAHLGIDGEDPSATLTDPAGVDVRLVAV